jgi:pantoate--beta-alanine ligase
MKLIKHITDLNKAVNSDKELGFVPTMGGLHQGHVSLIKISKKKCTKTLVSIFINPKQFDRKNDYINYPRSLEKDLKILKKLNVDFVYIPTVKQIYKEKEIIKISLRKSDKVLCAKYRKGHFEGVLDVLSRFVRLISPKIVFLGEKDYQQFFLVKSFIEKKYNTRVVLCKTIRDSNKIALSSRNSLLNKKSLKISSFISNKLFNLKLKINQNKNESKILTKLLRESLIKEFNLKIDYLECRNLLDLSSNINKKKYKIFIAYYLDTVRLIDNF